MEEGTVAYQLYVGIDIAADTFTAAWRTRAGKPTLPFTPRHDMPGLPQSWCFDGIAPERWGTRTGNGRKYAPSGR